MVYVYVGMYVPGAFWVAYQASHFVFQSLEPFKKIYHNKVSWGKKKGLKIDFKRKKFKIKFSFRCKLSLQKNWNKNKRKDMEYNNISQAHKMT